jgi:monoamine oxidase
VTAGQPGATLAVRPIHFAGEHCSQDYQGYIQGGADEGIRAAAEIVADYR